MKAKHLKPARFSDMRPGRLREILDRFPSRRIAVIGDFFLDKYLDIDPSIAGISVESGRTAHQVVRVRTSPGCAGTVVSNLSALDAGVLHAIGFVGEDGEGYDVRAGLKRLRCRTDGLCVAPDRMTPTYLKPRNMTDPTLAGEHDRYDTKNRTPTPPRLLRDILRALDERLPDLDAVIISDQIEMDECGVIASPVREALGVRAGARPGVVFLVDSRAHIREFRNVILKPNQSEAVGMIDAPPGFEVTEDRLLEVLPELRRRANAPVCVTRGAKGMLVSDPEITLVPAVRVEGPLDITGAGDASAAGAVLALASGATLPEAALVANLVASITIQQLAATGTARRDQLPERLEMWRAQNRKES